MSIHRQFGSGVAWMAAGNWIEQGINFALFVILARLLGAEAYGLMAMAAAFVLIGEALVRDSFSDFLIAAKDPQPGHFNATFWILALFGLGLGAAMALAAGPLADLYGEARVSAPMRALAASIPMIALTAVPVAMLRREMRLRVLALRAVAGVIGGGLVALALALSGFGVWALVAQRLVQVLINVAMAWLAVAWRPGAPPRGAEGRAQAASVLRFGGAVLWLRAGEIAAVQLPLALIGARLGPAAAGVFSLAWRVVEIGSFLIVTPLRLASQPAFAAMRRAGGDPAGLLLDVERLAGMVALPAFAGLAALAHPVVALMFGPGWAEAGAPLGVLAFLGAYFCIEKVHQAYCLAMGQARATALLAWAEALAASGLVWLAAPFGPMAVAGAVVAAFLLLWGLRLRTVAALAGLSAPRLARVHLPPLIGAGLMAALVHFAPPWLGATRPIAALGLGAGLGALAFFLFALAFMPDRLRLLRGFLAAPPAACATEGQ